jgi:hypothetical protein
VKHKVTLTITSLLSILFMVRAAGALKRGYDSTNVFRLNQNILP